MVVLACTDVEKRRSLHDELTQSNLTVIDASTIDEVVPLATRFVADVVVMDPDGFGDEAGVTRELCAWNRIAFVELSNREELLAAILVALAAAAVEEPRLIECAR